MKTVISEIYHAIQGEGRFNGVPSAFVRTSGCNLRCWFCDTKYTSWHPEGKLQHVDAVMQTILDLHAPHVVITGGEPMLFAAAVAELVERCERLGKAVTIETNGTVIEENIHPTLWSVSPKLASSAPVLDQHPKEFEMHVKNNAVDYLKWAEIDRELGNVQFKFVITNSGDVETVKMFSEKYQINPHSIWAMPEGVTREAIIEGGLRLTEVCKANGWNLCLRSHVLLYGNMRGV